MPDLTLRDIFTDYNADGFRDSFREFLGYFAKQFWPGVNTQIDKLYLARLEYPLLVLPFYLLAFLTLLVFWERPSRRRALAAGAVAGLLAYAYFHLWAYWMMVIALLAARAFVCRHRDPERWRGMLALGAASALSALPYLVNQFWFSRLPGAYDLALRLGLAEGRTPALRYLGFDYLFYAGVAVLVWWLYVRRWRMRRERAVLFLAMIGAVVAVWNVQVLLGAVPFPMHWDRIASPALFIILAVLMHDVASRVASGRRRVAVAMAIVLAMATALALTKKMVNVLAIRRDPQAWVLRKYQFPREVAESFAWINENLGREPKVVSSSFMTAHFLTVYTSARPYLVLWFFAPVEQSILEERYLTASRLFGVPEAMIRYQLAEEGLPPCSGAHCFDIEDNIRKTAYYLYGYYFRRGSVNEYFIAHGAVPEERLSLLLARYRELDPRWQDSGAAYVYYGPWERQFSAPDLGQDPVLERVYENPLVEIYRIKGAGGGSAGASAAPQG